MSSKTRSILPEGIYILHKEKNITISWHSKKRLKENQNLVIHHQDGKRFIWQRWPWKRPWYRPWQKGRQAINQSKQPG